jgi:Phage integrase, N-terminal SAM-like domain
VGQSLLPAPTEHLLRSMPRAATPGTLGALGIARIVSRHAAAADLPEDRGCRTWRHTFCTQLADTGADAAVIRELAGHAAALRTAPLSEQTRRTYTSKVRQFLAWLAGADHDADPLTGADGRDWAVRDYRTHLQTVLKRSPATVNNALAAVDDFYIRRGLGPARAARIQITAAAPRALDQRAQLRYLREVQRCPSPRDQALALVPFYAGARIGGDCLTGRNRRTSLVELHAAVAVRRGRSCPAGRSLLKS